MRPCTIRPKAVRGRRPLRGTQSRWDYTPRTYGSPKGTLVRFVLRTYYRTLRRARTSPSGGSGPPRTLPRSPFGTLRVPRVQSLRDWGPSGHTVKGLRPIAAFGRREPTALPPTADWATPNGPSARCRRIGGPIGVDPGPEGVSWGPIGGYNGRRGQKLEEKVTAWAFLGENTSVLRILYTSASKRSVCWVVPPCAYAARTEEQRSCSSVLAAYAQ